MVNIFSQRIFFAMNNWYRVIFSIIFLTLKQESAGTIFSNHAPKYFTSVVKVMGQLLQNCYDNYQTVVVCDDSNTYLLQSLLEMPSISSMVHKTGAQIEHNIILFNKVDAFIISTNSTEQLNRTLLSMKITPYWDIKSTFFILGDSADNCSKASTILQTAWDNNLISAYYICLNEKPVIYTFNPYARRAPKSWTLSNVITRRNNKWTLYSREYKREHICSDFNFDRLKYFDGANISIAACISSTVPSTRIRNHGLTIANTLSRILNFTALRIDADAAPQPTVDLQGFYLLLDNASAEFAVCTRSSMLRYNFSVSYPILRGKFHIISHHRGYYTPLEKISNFYGKWVLLFTLLILIAIYFAVLFSNKGRKYSFAFFEILRFLTNLGFSTPMDTLAKRIFFCVILIYSVILQATFQGQLSTFLTKAESRRNAETIDDLLASHYKQVFAIVPTEPYWTEIPDLKKKVKIMGARFCAEEIVGKKSTACINFSFFLSFPAVSYKLYLSKNFIAEDCNIFLFRRDSPLEIRINEFFIRLEQTGLTKLWSEGLVSEDMMLLKMIEERSVIDFRLISLEDIAFTFYLLGIGLSLSSIVFISELLFKKYFWKVYNFISQLF